MVPEYVDLSFSVRLATYYYDAGYNTEHGGEYERDGGEYERDGGEYERDGGEYERDGGGERSSNLLAIRARIGGVPFPFIA